MQQHSEGRSQSPEIKPRSPERATPQEMARQMESQLEDDLDKLSLLNTKLRELADYKPLAREVAPAWTAAIALEARVAALKPERIGGPRPNELAVRVRHLQDLYNGSRDVYGRIMGEETATQEALRVARSSTNKKIDELLPVLQSMRPGERSREEVSGGTLEMTTSELNERRQSLLSDRDYTSGRLDRANALNSSGSLRESDLVKRYRTEAGEIRRELELIHSALKSREEHAEAL